MTTLGAGGGGVYRGLLAGLQPGTTYYYEIFSDEVADVIVSSQFDTHPVGDVTITATEGNIEVGDALPEEAELSDFVKVEASAIELNAEAGEILVRESAVLRTADLGDRCRFAGGSAGTGQGCGRPDHHRRQ